MALAGPGAVQLHRTARSWYDRTGTNQHGTVPYRTSASSITIYELYNYIRNISSIPRVPYIL